MKTLYFDCGCGASGDMIVGALLDAGGDLDALREALASLQVPGYEIAADKVRKRGIMATGFSVSIVPDHEPPKRHMPDIVKLIERGALPEAVKAAARATFERLADCEAKVHGTTPDKVHFHEVGAIDSIVDIVGAHFLAHALGVERVVASPLRLGHGTVETAHGVLPVPAPATALLLEGAPCYGGELEGEFTTPTGAALITQLAAGFGPMPMMSIEAMGYGAGRRDLPDRANTLRVCIGEAGASFAGATEPIVVIEANIDDMVPELFPGLIEDLLRDGARDAYLTPIVGKKGGRPGQLLTVLCDEAEVTRVTRTLFRGSTTLGLRMRTDQRICLERSWRTVGTPWGAVRVKMGELDGEVTCASPEYEDCRKTAEAAAVPVLAVYHAALATAVKGEFNDA